MPPGMFPEPLRGESHIMDRRYRMPFFGMLDTAPHEAEFIVLMQPIGHRTQPGARFAFAHVFIERASVWRAFEGDVRCHRLAHFGISIELRETPRGELVLETSAPDHTKARAQLRDGSRARWQHEAPHCIVVHPSLRDLTRQAAEHFGFDPSASATRL